MASRKQYLVLISALAFTALLWVAVGCKKEYSCEGCGTVRIDSQPAPIPIPQPPPIQYSKTCSLCDPSKPAALSEWNFKTGDQYMCGIVTNAGAGIDPEKRAFTFFGPSACSNDTGLVMTVYVPLPMDRDRFNMTSAKAAFYYYDHNATKDIFITLAPLHFYVLLRTFTYATGIATGTFWGTAYKANGDTANIVDGNFKIKLKY